MSQKKINGFMDDLKFDEDVGHKSKIVLRQFMYDTSAAYTNWITEMKLGLNVLIVCWVTKWYFNYNWNDIINYESIDRYLCDCIYNADNRFCALYRRSWMCLYLKWLSTAQFQTRNEFQISWNVELNSTIRTPRWLVLQSSVSYEAGTILPPYLCLLAIHWKS